MSEAQRQSVAIDLKIKNGLCGRMSCKVKLFPQRNINARSLLWKCMKFIRRNCIAIYAATLKEDAKSGNVS